MRKTAGNVILIIARRQISGRDILFSGAAAPECKRKISMTAPNEGYIRQTGLAFVNQQKEFILLAYFTDGCRGNEK